MEEAPVRFDTSPAVNPWSLRRERKSAKRAGEGKRRGTKGGTP
jgi:hypothetical protein